MAQRISRFKKGLVIAAAAALTLGGAGAAFAYWTSQGTGVGEATTDTSVDFIITSEAAVGTISPGNAGQTIDFTVTNPGEGSQQLTTVTVRLADAAGDPWVPAGDCLFADYVATISTAPAPGQIAGGGSVDGVATVTLTNTGINQDDCQGQAVPLYFETDSTLA